MVQVKRQTSHLDYYVESHHQLFDRLLAIQNSVQTGYIDSKSAIIDA